MLVRVWNFILGWFGVGVRPEGITESARHSFKVVVRNWDGSVKSTQLYYTEAKARMAQAFWVENAYQVDFYTRGS